METMVIDNRTPMDALLSFAGAKRAIISKNDGDAEGQFALTVEERGDIAPISEKQAKLRAIFDKHRVDLTNFKFNRDEANNYG
jgi:hypothetical protein